MSQRRYTSINIYTKAAVVIKDLCKKKNLSVCGFISALIYTIDSRADYGDLNIDWDKLQQDYPSQASTRQESWDRVQDMVLKDLEKQAPCHVHKLHSKLSPKQVFKALENLQRDGKIHIEDDTISITPKTKRRRRKK